MTDQPANAAADAAVASVKWTDRIAGRMQRNNELHGGFGINSLKGAAGESLVEVKSAFSRAAEHGRAVGFARVGAVGLGGYVASGAFQSKNSDGTDRGPLHRLTNAVVGGGMMVGGVLMGGR